MIYYDNAATTEVHPLAIDAINKVLAEYGNPSSLYTHGDRTKTIIENARHIIATELGVRSSEIIFTSSGSESNSLAIYGWAKRHPDGVIITSMLEHKSILRCVADIDFCKICYVDCDTNGMVNVDSLQNLLKDNQGKDILVSVQHVNNELGTINDIAVLSHLIHHYGGEFHCDATQSFGALDIDASLIDMITVSGHKIGCPKGIAFLYKKDTVNIAPIIYGTQEHGLRGGTENVPYINALGVMVSKIKTIRQKSNALFPIKQHIVEKLQEEFTDTICLNGDITSIIPTINVSFKGLSGEALLYLLDIDECCVSTGSACNGHDISQSLVLKTIKVDSEFIDGTIRISLPLNTSEQEADEFLELLIKNVKITRERGM